MAAATPDVTFTGTTYTHKDVAEFMTRLGLIPQLSNVRLASSTGADGGSRRQRSDGEDDRHLHRDGHAAAVQTPPAALP